MPAKGAAHQQPLSKWPLYELLAYGRELGLELSDDISRKDLVDAIRARQELILELDETGLRDVVAWAGLRCSPGDSKEQLAKRIATIRKMRFTGLSDTGLYTLARLRSVDVQPDEPRSQVIRRLKQAESFWGKLTRKKRRVVASWLAKALVGRPTDEQEASADGREAIDEFKDSLEEGGIVGGLAGKIKTAADVYVAEKLDEIEQRIDQKLDEIDRRLAEWRDREVATRLRIIKITLVASVVVALLSLGYTVFKQRVLSGDIDGPPVAGSSQPGPNAETEK